jgi:hypothetical protein
VNVEGAEIKNTESKARASAFVRVEGNASKNIRLDKNRSQSKKEMELAPDVNPDVVSK